MLSQDALAAAAADRSGVTIPAEARIAAGAMTLEAAGPSAPMAQRLSVALDIGQEAIGIYDVDLRCGIVTGIIGAHRMKAALAMVKMEFVTEDPTGNEVITPSIMESIPTPKIAISDISHGDVSINQANKTATFTIAGQVEDGLAQIMRNGEGDLHNVRIYGEGQLIQTVALNKIIDANSLLRPYAHHYQFSTQVTIPVDHNEINMVEIVTDSNASNRSGRSAIVIPVSRDYGHDSSSGAPIGTTTLNLTISGPLPPETIDHVVGSLESGSFTVPLAGDETTSDSRIFTHTESDMNGNIIFSSNVFADKNVSLSSEAIDLLPVTITGWSLLGGGFTLTCLLTETGINTNDFSGTVLTGGSGSGSVGENNHYTLSLGEPTVINQRSDVGQFRPYAIRFEHPFNGNAGVKIGGFEYNLSVGADGHKYISGSPIKVFVATAKDGQRVLIGLEHPEKIGDKITLSLNGSESEVTVNSMETLTLTPDRGMGGTSQEVKAVITNYQWPQGAVLTLGDVASVPPCKTLNSNQTLQGEFVLPMPAVDEQKRIGIELNEGGHFARYPDIFFVSNPADTTIWYGTIPGSVIPYCFNRNFNQIGEWAELNFAPKAAYWVHPLEWDELSFLERGGLDRVTADTLSDEDREKADKKLSFIPADRRYIAYARYKTRARVLVQLKLAVSSGAILSYYRLARDLNPLHFAAERGWQIGGGEEMFTGIPRSRIAAAVELIVACALAKGVDVALSSAKALALQPVFRGAYVPRLERLSLRGSPPFTPPSPNVRTLNAQTISELEGEYIFARNGNGEFAVLAEGQNVKHYEIFGTNGTYTGAGTMKIQGGRITEIGNQSGHLRPSVDNFMDNVLQLRSSGIPIEAQAGGVKIVVDWD